MDQALPMGGLAAVMAQYDVIRTEGHQGEQADQGDAPQPAEDTPPWQPEVVTLNVTTQQEKQRVVAPS